MKVDEIYILLELRKNGIMFLHHFQTEIEGSMKTKIQYMMKKGLISFSAGYQMTPKAKELLNQHIEKVLSLV